MKATVAILLGVGVTDLVALDAWVAPQLLAERTAPAAERVAAGPPPRVEPDPTPAPVQLPAPEREREREVATSASLETPAPLTVYFALDRATIFPATASILDGVADTLAARPDLAVTITAHACASGTDHHNESLTRRRARRVAEHLASRGIDPARIATVARGERDARTREPIAREDRRVDLAFRSLP